MPEHVILVSGPMGVGKTTSIRAVSDVRVVSTEAVNSDRAAADKDTTTVALDYGEIIISDEEKLRIYGLPGQRRFEFMWRILLGRAMGVIVLLDATAADPLGDLREQLEVFAPLLAKGSALIGVTRTELAPAPTLSEYSEVAAALHPGRMIPVLPVDARDRAQMRVALMSLVATIEMESRLALERTGS